VSRPRIGVLALQGDVREHERALEAVGATTSRVRRAEELAGLDGLVLPGGESTTIGRLLRVLGLLEPTCDAMADGLPVYGSCAGMVLLASRLLDGKPGQSLLGGLDVTVRRNAFGRQVDSFEGVVDWPGLGADPLQAVFIRAPWVEEVGPDVEVLGRLSRQGLRRLDPAPPSAARVADEDQAEVASGTVVAVRQGHVLATAFHPELTGDLRVHRLFVDGIVRDRREEV
jgi:5'-phosphate synthase pdxT subunit